jgi:hypothetical protein
MQKLFLSFSALAFLFFTGCEDKKKVEVNAPGVQVKTGEGNTEVKTPAGDVDVKNK